MIDLPPSGWTLLQGDCRKLAPAFPDDAFDSIVTDPPYDLVLKSRGRRGFMGHSWDATGVAFDPATWLELLRVCKPGAHLLAFGAPRTYHRMAVAIEDAGWEIRDSIHWTYSQGFPKSLNLGDDLKGLGTSLKPSHEPIVVARKPLEGTVEANVRAHGTGALNINASRNAHAGAATFTDRTPETHGTEFGMGAGAGRTESSVGRWPANTLLSHSPNCTRKGDRQVRSGTAVEPGHVDRPRNVANAPKLYVGQTAGFADEDGLETIPDFDCTPDCPVRLLDEQSGELASGRAPPPGYVGKMVKSVALGDKVSVANPAAYYGDRGGASRFFNTFELEEDDLPAFLYCAKVSAAEREGNRHPTVKPISLMRHLVRMVTPPNGLVLDPFAGSGTTVLAALREQRRVVGLELKSVYADFARHRIVGDAPLLNGAHR